MTHELIKYEAACLALAECKSVDEAKDWANKAAAMQAYGRMAKDRTLEVDAAEIRIRAERRLGEMLLHQKAGEGLAKPGVKPKTYSVVTGDRIPTLADSGISKDQSSRAQKLAAAPVAVFEAELAAKRGRDRADGARVSARLELAGAKVLGATHQAAPDDAATIDELLAELQADNANMAKLLAVAEASDQQAEALKWRRAYDTAVRGQSEAMERAHSEVKRHEATHRWLIRCGKMVDELDPMKIAAAVEAFVRRHRVAA